MNLPALSRRRLMQLGISAAAGSALTSGTSLAQSSSSFGGGDEDHGQASASVNNAFLFLDQMMDAYAQGSTVRLAQSYSDQIAGGTFYSTAFIYDNASARPGLSCPRPRQRSQPRHVLGNALLYAQKSDPAGDGRFRQAYFAGVRITTASTSPLACRTFRAAPSATSPGRASRWPSSMPTPAAELSAGRHQGRDLHRRPPRDKDPNPPGGYFFGNGQTNKSTEHNIDVDALFSMPARLTGDSQVAERSQLRQAPSSRPCSMPPPATSGPAPPTPPTSSTTTARKTCRPGPISPSKTPPTPSPSNGSRPTSRPPTTSFAFNNGWGVNRHPQLPGQRHDLRQPQQARHRARRQDAWTPMPSGSKAPDTLSPPCSSVAFQQPRTSPASMATSPWPSN